MKKTLIFLVGLFIGLIIFMPKENLYFTLQKYLAKEKIYINSKIKSNLTLTLSHGKIYQNGMNLASFEKTEIIPFIFYNKIISKNIKINFQNYKIKNLSITYSILNPVKIYISGKSSFGIISGEINLLKRFVRIYILNLSDVNLKTFLRKDDKGYFYYAKF